MTTSAPPGVAPAGLDGAGLQILEEAEGWLTVLKPAGLPVFPPHADPQGDCVLARLLLRRPEQAGPDWERGFEGGLCHRLDTGTSGLLLVARAPAALRRIRAAFSSHGLEKRYLLVSARAPAWRTTEIDRPIAHDARRPDRMIVQRGVDTPHRGQWYPARTTFERAPFTVEGGTVWQATMRSGVMHQIRAHAAAAGLALAGDRRYGGGAPLPWFGPLELCLHHLGLSGEGLHPRPAPLPSWPLRSLPTQRAPAEGVPVENVPHGHARAR